MIFNKWVIPLRIIEETISALTSRKSEIFVLWTSTLNPVDSTCRISRCVVPVQKPGRTLYGVYVHIEGKELNRIQFDNYDQNELNVVQLHTHPSRNVCMSDLDKEWEVVKHIGALSIIVPSYGKKGLIDFLGVNVYERETNGWRLWEKNEVADRLIIERPI